MRYAIALILLCSIFACGSPTAPTSAVPLPGKVSTVKGPNPFLCGGCTTPDGRSGYMVTAGDKCQPC